MPDSSHPPVRAPQQANQQRRYPDMGPFHRHAEDSAPPAPHGTGGSTPLWTKERPLACTSLGVENCAQAPPVAPPTDSSAASAVLVEASLQGWWWVAIT